jgi:hypothetical protein
MGIGCDINVPLRAPSSGTIVAGRDGRFDVSTGLWTTAPTASIATASTNIGTEKREVNERPDFLVAMNLSPTSEP